MLNLVSLIVAAALVSLQCNFEASAQMDRRMNSNKDLLHKNATPRRPLKLFVYFSLAPPTTVKHIAGTRLELECQAVGRPAPTIKWYKNGEVLEDYLDESNELLLPDKTSQGMLVSKLILPTASEGDVLTCFATAGLNTKSTSTTVVPDDENEPSKLLTLTNLISLPMKPVITNYYDFILQELGTSLVLPCKVYSETKAQIFWQDHAYNLVYDDGRRQVLPTGDLVIWPLNFEDDTGNYTCFVNNAYGKDWATTFVLPLKPSKQ